MLFIAISSREISVSSMVGATIDCLKWFERGTSKLNDTKQGSLFIHIEFFAQGLPRCTTWRATAFDRKECQLAHKVAGQLYNTIALGLERTRELRKQRAASCRDGRCKEILEVI